VPAILVVHPGLPARSVAELLAYLRANPGKVAFASSGNGTTSHMAGELFKMLTGADIIHVPYRGGGPALAALMAGEVQMDIDLMANLYPQVQPAACAASRHGGAARRRAPDLPTMEEAGVPGYRIAPRMRSMPGRHAAPDRRQAQCRDHWRAARSRRARAPAGARHRAVAEHAEQLASMSRPSSRCGQAGQAIRGQGR